nr:hypothetical protein [Treponema sp.]MBP3283841.1 hypothetical protein [Treponema sp.]
MAASVLRRRVTEEDMAEANGATERQVAMIFGSMSPAADGSSGDTPPDRKAEEPVTEKVAADEGDGGGGLLIEKPERKTRRVQLVMTESVYRKSREMAGKMGMSLNDYIHTLLARMARMDI